jgi:hypothetical protein
MIMITTMTATTMMGMTTTATTILIQGITITGLATRDPDPTAPGIPADRMPAAGPAMGIDRGVIVAGPTAALQEVATMAVHTRAATTGAAPTTEAGPTMAAEGLIMAVVPIMAAAPTAAVDSTGADSTEVVPRVVDSTEVVPRVVDSTVEASPEEDSTAEAFPAAVTEVAIAEAQIQRVKGDGSPEKL